MESTGTAMNYIALQQAIQGKMIMIGGDLFTGTAKPKLYGTFYHPHLLIGMPSMGGDVKVYIDAVCWTEKHPSNTLAKAGHRKVLNATIYHR